MPKFVIDNGKNLFESYDKPEIDAFVGKIITGTLQTGQTTITLSDSSITTNSMFDFYTSIYGVNPKAVNVSTGSIELEFDEQEEDVGVKVRVY